MVSNEAIFMMLCTFASLGILINIISLLIHSLLPKLIKHPGSLILLHMICQIPVLSHWIITFPTEIL